MARYAVEAWFFALRWCLPDKTGPSLLLKGRFGFNGNTELIEVIAYFIDLIGALCSLLKPSPAPAQSS